MRWSVSRCQANAPGRVILTAVMVRSAIDIEQAIVQATDGGTRPGLVILDGRDGPFNYAPDAEDLEVNIFVSNLVLRGVRKAILQGSAIRLDGMALHNITIKDLEMHCPQDCILSRDGPRQSVIVSRNSLQAVNNGIDIVRAGGWQIKNNRVIAGQVSVHLVSVTEISVRNNHLQAYIPVMLEQSDHCRINRNTLIAERHGVHLAIDSQANQVIANFIRSVQGPGIGLQEGTQDNDVHANGVECPEGSWAPCPVADWGEGNHTGGNR
jgi:hypothetical protein